MSEPIRQDRVNAFLAFMAQHGASALVHKDLSQFGDLTHDEQVAAVRKREAQLAAMNAQVARLKKMRKRSR